MPLKTRAPKGTDSPGSCEKIGSQAKAPAPLIRKPLCITVGQALRLRPNGPAPSTVRPQAPQPRSVPQSPAGSASPPWAWPVDPAPEPRAVQGGGIILSGRLGQDVRAAAAGRVVYAGTGIRGYGNLIIIKHGENWLSAYAHNRESLVREGQEISSGQVIGHMGEGAPGKPALYFEIRRNGKPVDPLKLLPAAK